MKIYLKTREEIELMRKAGSIVFGALETAEHEIKAGMTTSDLDGIIEEYILSQGARPAFKGYQGYPAAACISINEEVVHGIPGKRVINDGDIVSVDVGSLINDFYGDSARTLAVGEIGPEKQRLMEVTRQSLMAGIDKARKGNRLGEISAAVQRVAEDAGYGVVRQLVGHGIGRRMHEEPQVPNFGSPKEGPVLEIGMVIAIEPMINVGTYDVLTMPDGWTIVTADGQPSAHFEHMVAITENGPDILSLV